MVYNTIKIILFSIITLASSFLTYNISNTKNNIIKNETVFVENKKEEKELMTIEIPKLNLKNKIYNINSELNNIDKNVIILEGSSMPDEKNGIILIGAHSGTGRLAYFKNLNQLNNNDEIILNYKNKKYYYKVVKKYLSKKSDGLIFNNDSNNKKLFLYTCNPNDKNNYLVIVCEEK